MSTEVLLHFSEDPTIEVFRPVDRYVWAITEAAQSLYWFPRDCPRAVWWPAGRFDERVYAVEWGWLDRIRDCVLYAYAFDAAPFIARGDDADQRFRTTTETVTPLSVEAVGPLLECHEAAGHELRIVPSLAPIHAEFGERHAAGDRSIDFSIIRMRNAGDRAQQTR